jgi:hypothetical protein
MMMSQPKRSSDANPTQGLAPVLRDEVKTESDVKTVIAWGSIAYAFGFVTVMLHTSRLGFPVLELLSPVYIWVGLPLAVLAFFSRQLAKFLKLRADQLAEELKTSWRQLTGEVPREVEVIYEAFALLVTLIPLLGVLRYPLESLVRKTISSDPTRVKRAASYMPRLAALFTAMAAVIGIFRTLNIALAVVFGVYFYVWHLYPLIPQSLGGGRPRTVQLLIVTDKASAVLSDLQATQTSAKETPGAKGVITAPLALLYMTREDYYIQGRTGLLISLNRDAVEGVVWNPR